MAAHLAGCAACRDEQVALPPALLDLSAPPISADFAQRLLASLPSESPRQLAQQARGRRRQRRAIIGFGVALAVVMLQIGLLGVFVNSEIPARMVGGVETTLGRALLALTIAAKPLAHALGLITLPLLVLSIAAMLAVGGLWLRLLTPPSRLAVGVMPGMVGLALLAALVPGATRAHIANPPGALVVAASSVHQGNLASVSQPIVIDGWVRGDVTSVSGTIVVRGRVDGDIVTWGGSVWVEPTAEVAGHAMALAGAVARERDAAVTGQVYTGNLSRAGFASLLPGSVGPEVSLTGRLGLALALLILGVASSALLGAVWPHLVAEAVTVVQQLPARALALGVLTAVLFGLLLAATLIVLALSLVGLLAMPLALLLLHLPFVLGLAVAAQSLERWLDLEMRGVVGAVLLLAPAFMLALLLPLAGLLGFHLAAAVGTGGLLLRVAALRLAPA